MRHACSLALIALSALITAHPEAGAPERVATLGATLGARSAGATDQPTCTIPTDRWRRGLDVGAPLPDGHPLRVDQFPRVLTPTHDGPFGFERVSVLGDYPSVTFERPDSTQSEGVVRETWTRVGTTSIAGRLISEFRPVWEVAVLHRALADQRWGIDRPSLYLGRLVVPGGATRALHLRLAPPNISASTVARIDDTVQFASHVVNLWIPGYGDSRVTGGDANWELPDVAQRFYTHFADAYETLVVVTQLSELTGSDGFHQNVRNEIAGIGLELFDDSAPYGSASVLQGVEVFPSPRWAENATQLHQQAHQWSDYSAAWDAVGIVRQGEAPTVHSPLLTPGAVHAGAVLDATRRVDGSEGAYRIAQTLPTAVYSALTLYRMGVIAGSELPTYRVFEDQGQFDPSQRVTPSVGAPVQGQAVVVEHDQVVAADGVRNGPTPSSIRRAVIYVSRTGLASKAEMDVVNFFAARLGTASGVTSWDGMPSFFEATGGRVTASTEITPRAAGKVPAGSDVAFFPVAADALLGVRLDNPVPGRIGIGQTVTISGSLTLDDRADYDVVCFRFIRYGSADLNETFLCGSLTRGRFSIPVTFAPGQQGTYTIEPFAFWEGSGPQAARSRYGVITVGD